MNKNESEQTLLRSLSAVQRLDPEQAGSSLHDEIYKLMEEALIAGDFAPGQVLSTRMLAKYFGTSVIPVRDALKRLVSEHALVTLSNRRFCVPRMTRSHFQEFLQIRLCLEPMLAQRATTLVAEATIRELERINELMQEAGENNDVRGYLTANKSFHFSLYRAANSQVGLPIVVNLWLRVGPFLNGMFTALGTRNARDNHAQVLRALRRRDPVETGRAISSDLADAADVILANHDFLIEDDDGIEPSPAGECDGPGKSSGVSDKQA